MIAGVEATRDEHELRAKGLGDRHDYRAKCGQVLGVAHRRLELAVEGYVDVLAKTGVLAALVDGARARKKVTIVVSVQGHVEYARIVVGHLLGAVAVVHVPIHDSYALQAQILFEHLGNYCHRVEITKAPILVKTRVVSIFKFNRGKKKFTKK
jgi:hypothetical protein